MRKVITLGLIFILVLSCKKKEKTYYPDGTLKTIVGLKNSKFHGLFRSFYENGELEIEGLYEYGAMQGVYTYYQKLEHQFSKSEMLFKNDTVYYWWNYDKYGKLVEEGPVKENSKVGKWTYYDIEDGYTKKIREVFYINGKSHLNQEWLLNRQGDTIGGRYYVLDANDRLDFYNQNIRFNVEWLPYYINSEIYVCIPKKGSKQFNEHFSNEKEVNFDTISNPLLWKTDNDIVVNLNYDTPGQKMLRGYLLEKKSVEDIDSLDFNIITRKIYFEKEIYIGD